MKLILQMSFCLLYSLSAVYGQERVGTAVDNYMPTNGIFLNPSSSADSRTYMQLKFVGVNAFAMTNIAYIPKISLWSYKATGEIPLPVVSELSRNRFVQVNLGTEGPAFSISKNNIGAGIFVRARSVFHIKRLPHQLTSLILSQEPIGPNQGDLNISNAGFNNMSWFDAGVNFSYIVSKRGDRMSQIGINAYYIIGYNFLYGRIQSMLGQYNDSVINLSFVRGSLVRSSPVFSSGKGFGVDLGYTSKKMLSNVDNYMPHSQRSNCRAIDYKYKWGISLRDVGYIRFRAGVSSREFSGSGSLAVEQQRGDFTKIPAVNVNVTESLEPFRALLPVSVSGQFDYNFENNLFLGAVVVKNAVPLAWKGAQGNDLLAVVPRVEFRDFAVALPVTLQKFIYPQAGFSLRLRSLVVGVDNVIPLIIKSNLRHMGIYATFAASVFKNPACRSKVRNVDDCMPGIRIRNKKSGRFFRDLFGGNKTYRK